MFEHTYIQMMDRITIVSFLLCTIAIHKLCILQEKNNGQANVTCNKMEMCSKLLLKDESYVFGTSIQNRNYVRNKIGFI